MSNRKVEIVVNIVTPPNIRNTRWYEAESRVLLKVVSLVSTLVTSAVRLI